MTDHIEPNKESEEEEKNIQYGSRVYWELFFLMTLALVFVFLAAFHIKWEVTSLILIIYGLGGYMLVGWLLRYLGERGIFVAICPTNKELAIEKYGNVQKLVFAPTKNRRDDVITWCKTKKVKCVILDEGFSGLVWVGFPKIYKVRGYYLTKLDERADQEENNRSRELHSLYLGQILLQWDSAHKGKTSDGTVQQGLTSGYDPNGIPDYESADPVRVASALTLYLRAADFTKPLYAVNYLKDAIKDLMLECYRRTLSELRFFTQAEKEVEKMEDKEKGALRTESRAERKAMEMLERFKPEIIQTANRKFRINLGIAKLSKKENIEVDFLDPEKFPPDSVAYRILEEFGMQIVDVAITDLEEDPVLREKLAEMLMAWAKRQVTVTTALGKKEAAELDGAGEMKRLKQVIKSFEPDQKKQEVPIENYVPSPAALAQYQLYLKMQTLKELPKEGRTVILPFPMGEGSESDVLQKLIAAIPALKPLLESQDQKANQSGDTSDTGETEEEST